MNAFQKLQHRNGKPYNYYSSSIIARERKLHIPISFVPHPNRAGEVAPDVNEKGLKRYYPWFVTNDNSAKNDANVNIMLKLLSSMRLILGLGQYPFVRMDVSLYMQWLRVGIHILILKLFA